MATDIDNFLNMQGADRDLSVTAIATTARREFGILGDAALTLSGIARVMLACLMRPKPILHLHLASRGSALRKGIIVQIARLFRVPCLMHDHGIQPYYERSGRLVRWWMRTLFRHSRVVVILAECDRPLIETFTKAPIVFVPNGIMIPPEEAMARPGEGEGPTQFLFLGGDMRRKGIFTLLDAVVSLRQEGLPLSLTIAGADRSGEVEPRIRQLGLDECVRMIGWVEGDAKAQVLRNSDIFVLPSFREGLPVALLEAMSYGLPAIASTVGGIPEAVVAGETGLLVEPGDAAGLAAAMKALADDPELRRKMGAAGRRRAESLYAIPVICARIKELYRQMAVQD